MIIGTCEWACPFHSMYMHWEIVKGKYVKKIIYIIQYNILPSISNLIVLHCIMQYYTRTNPFQANMSRFFCLSWFGEPVYHRDISIWNRLLQHSTKLFTALFYTTLPCSTIQQFFKSTCIIFWSIFRLFNFIFHSTFFSFFLFFFFLFFF